MNAKILHLISSNYFFGAERVVVELCRYLQPRGLSMHIGLLARSEELNDLFRSEIHDQRVRLRHFNGRGRLNLATIAHIARYMLDHHIDLIHCHGYKSNFYASLATKFAQKKTPIITTNHGWKKGSWQERIYNLLDASLLRRSVDAIVTVSPQIKEQMAQLGIEAGQISVIDNGIDLRDSRFATSPHAARQTLGLPPDGYIIGNIARLAPEKAQDQLVRAVAELREITNLRLVLIGDGPQRDQLRQLAQNLGVQDRVLLTGNRGDARTLYAAFDLFLLPSHDEGLPMALLEAMAASIPVISTTVGAIPRVIRHHENGLLIAPGSTKELTHAIRHLHREPHLARQLAAAARTTVEKSFSSARMAETYYDKYRQLIAPQTIPNRQREQT